jgi:hypothetical protein
MFLNLYNYIVHLVIGIDLNWPGLLSNPLDLNWPVLLSNPLDFINTIFEMKLNNRTQVKSALQLFIRHDITNYFQAYEFMAKCTRYNILVDFDLINSGYSLIWS